MTTVHIPGFNLALTADSGQCFRFTQLAPGSFQLIAHGRLLQISELGGDRYAFSCDEGEFEALWSPYFDLQRDYGAILGSIPPEDSFLTEAAAFAGGLRILKQEPWEALICFIISQRKSLPAIKRCVRLLCERFGEPIGGGHFAFPAPEALAGASLPELNACGLGYRSPYILGTAQAVAAGKPSLETLPSLDDGALLKALCELPGVGVKVAHCAMLFGFQRMDAFPKDVWILRVLEAHYPEGFPLERFQGFAGIIQQYMFCYGRSPDYRNMQKYRENPPEA